MNRKSDKSHNIIGEKHLNVKKNENKKNVWKSHYLWYWLVVSFSNNLIINILSKMI